MRAALALFAALFLGACAHTDVEINSGSSVTSSSAGLQVNASGGLAAALAAGVIVAATLSEPGDFRPRYRSLSEWFSGPSAPEMDPRRAVSEQDCTKPIEGAGNLRCR